MSNTNWSADTNPSDTQWLRPGGIDTNIPLYNDSTIAYNDSTTYYDGYDATTITTDDVKPSSWTDIT